MTRQLTFVSDSARWDGFAFRHDDIVISTPPKSGTTWMQTICALLIFQDPQFYASLDLVSPWLDMLTRDLDGVKDALEAQTHRRFIKSHSPLDCIPWHERVTYICVGRDPRDVAMSWANHWANMDTEVLLRRRADVVGTEGLAEMLAAGPPPPPPSLSDSFRNWVDQPPPEHGLAQTVGHLSSFWKARDRHNVVLVRYEDLRADLEGSMRALARRLGIEVAEERWPVLVRAAGFDEMRARASELAPNATARLWKDDGQFFHRGTSGQWVDVIESEQLAHYHEMLASLAEPDLIAWLEGTTQP